MDNDEWQVKKNITDDLRRKIVSGNRGEWVKEWMEVSRNGWPFHFFQFISKPSLHMTGLRIRSIVVRN